MVAVALLVVPVTFCVSGSTVVCDIPILPLLEAGYSTVALFPLGVVTFVVALFVAGSVVATGVSSTFCTVTLNVFVLEAPKESVMLRSTL